MTWHITLIVLMAAFLALTGVVVALACADMTRNLNEHKKLRAELTDIQRELDSFGPRPTDEQMSCIQARIDRYRVRFAAFRG